MTISKIDQPGRPYRSPMRLGVTAGVLGAVLLMAGCGGDAFSEGDALGVVEAYYTAAETGDDDAITETFAEDVTVSGSADLTETLNFLAWDASQGTIYVDRGCNASGTESSSFVVACEYGNHQYLQLVVDAPATPITETFTVTADGIEGMDTSYNEPLFPANDAFISWMRTNYSQDAESADCCGEDGSIEEARSDGELRRQYADLWTVYLTETGCTYTDNGC